MNSTNFVFVFSDYYSKNEILDKLKNIELYMDSILNERKNCEYLHFWNLFPYSDGLNDYLLTYNEKSKTSKKIFDFVIAEAAHNLSNVNEKNRKTLEKCILDAICYEINRRVENDSPEKILNDFKKGLIYETNPLAKDIKIIKVIPLEQIFQHRKKKAKSFDYATLAEVYKLIEKMILHDPPFLEGIYFMNVDSNDPKNVRVKYISTIEKPFEEFEFYIDENKQLKYREKKKY